MKRLFAAAALAAMLGLAACASEGMMSPAKTGSSSLGPVLVDAKGMTLYTFDKDLGAKSMCNGPCATNWPPLMAPADATPGGSWIMVTKDPGMPPTLMPASSSPGPWTVITRDDGGKQWAYKGKPLYTWVRDKNPGDTTGDGFLNGAWHAAKP